MAVRVQRRQGNRGDKRLAMTRPKEPLSATSPDPHIEAFFTPRSVAVLGVSQRPHNLASNIVQNLQAWGYEGDILPVGRSGGEVHGLEVLSSVDHLPDGVELACVLTPAAAVPNIVEDLGRRGVRAVNIQSSGFAELSEGGGAMAARLQTAARGMGVRIIGPNCLGTINTAHRLCTPFSPIRPMGPGPVTVISQSGGVMFSYLRDLLDENLGLCKAVSFGNKLDVDEADLLRYLAHDPDTRVICLYLEDIRKGRALMEAAAACGKPVVLHKSNRSPLTVDIAASHTASLMSDHAVVQAAARQAGIISVDSTPEALTSIKALMMPRLRGRRIAVVSRSGGHAVIAADACQRHGFTLPPFPEDMLDDLRQRVRAGVTRMGNPLDLGDLWDMEAYEQVLQRVASLDSVDGVVYLFVAISSVDTAAFVKLTELMARVSRRTQKPISFCFMSWRDNLRQVARQAQERLQQPYPVFADVEEAVDALGVLWKAERYRRSVGTGKGKGTGRGKGRGKGKGTGTGKGKGMGNGKGIGMTACLEMLARHEVPMVETRVAPDAKGAAREAAQIGFPVALKLLSPRVVHKTDAGAVALGLGSALQVRQACGAMIASAQAAWPGDLELQGFAVQAMARPGLEVVVGFRRDVAFGPVVLVGLGGTLVEVLADTALRVAPVTPAQARQMLDDLSGRRLFYGVRGAPAVDREALARLVSNLSQLALAEETVAELELNPVMVLEQGQGCVAVDVRAFK